MHKNSSRIKSMVIMASIGTSALVHAGDIPAGATNTPRRVELGDLVCEWFAHMATSAPASKWRISGWDVTPPGTPFEHSYYSFFKMVDKSDEKPVVIGRRFPTQGDGILNWEFAFRMPQLADDTVFHLMARDKPFIRLRVLDGALTAEADGKAPVRLAAVQANRECGVSVRLDLDTHRAAIRVDGRVAAAAVPLPDMTPDRLAISTGNRFVGELFLGPVLLDRGYTLRERFISVPEGALPDGWSATTAGGKADIRRHGGAAHPADSRALCLERTGAGALDATVAIQPVSAGAVEVEAKLWLPQGGNGAAVAWTDAAGLPVLTLAVSNNTLLAKGAAGAAVELWQGVRTSVWYNLRATIAPAAGSATAYVNDIERGRVAVAAGARIAKVRVTAAEAVGSQCWADSFVVRPHLPYPADYAPEPVPVATGSNIVMMQSCDLWREGLHNGWDLIRDFPDRRPLLGYYNGGDPEVEDWTINWLTRNGIACDFKCWYQGAPGPIHSTRHGEGLIGFKRARWSNKMKFAINVTFPVNSLNDWRDNMVPYLIEHLFRDPRYQMIDNKPLIGIYETGKLAEGKAALVILRDECRKAGFDGCWVVNQGGPSKGATDLGFDAVYRYTWFTGSAKDQQKKIESDRAQKTQDVLPTLSMGWNSQPWEAGAGRSQEGGWASPDEFRALCSWAKTNYMPAAASNVLSRRVVMLDNWNEWGEGHCMMPAARWGFGYVHAVRDVFGQEPFPPDVQPTPAQVSRLTTLYPRGEGFEETATPAAKPAAEAGKATGTTVRVASAVKPEPGLLARWNLNDLEGEIVPDCSGNGHDGKLVRSQNPETWVTALVPPLERKASAYLLFDVWQIQVSNNHQLFTNITDTFTMALRVEPAKDERAATQETLQGADGMKGQRYAIWPPFGGGVNDGDKHAGAGLSIGCNGISVFEHGGAYMPAVLVHNAPLSGWNHVVVVYEKKQPKLYLNGVLVKTGLTGNRLVHPSAILGGGDYGRFAGRMGDVRIYDRALSAAEIEKLTADTK